MFCKVNFLKGFCIIELGVVIRTHKENTLLKDSRLLLKNKFFNPHEKDLLTFKRDTK